MLKYGAEIFIFALTSNKHSIYLTLKSINMVKSEAQMLIKSSYVFKFLNST